jgi:hypothetical protein
MAAKEEIEIIMFIGAEIDMKNGRMEIMLVTTH